MAMTSSTGQLVVHVLFCIVVGNEHAPSGCIAKQSEMVIDRDRVTKNV